MCKLAEKASFLACSSSSLDPFHSKYIDTIITRVDQEQSFLKAAEASATAAMTKRPFFIKGVHIYVHIKFEDTANAEISCPLVLVNFFGSADLFSQSLSN